MPVRYSVPGVLAVALASIFVCVAAVPIGAQQGANPPHFDIQKLSKGVYAVIRNEPASLWFNPNNAFIIGKRDVIVIDSNIAAVYTREVLDALRKITDKPVKYVINTHWHEDHIIGDRVYRDAFPAVKFIGHRSTLRDLPTIGAANRKGSVENGKGFVDLLTTQIAKREDLAGQRMTEEERLGYLSDIDLVGAYLAEAPDFEIIMPSILVDEHLDLDQDGRRVVVRFLGRAHTAADLVVFLPKEKILFSGDLIVWPVPLIGSTSYPLEYGETLKKLKNIKAKTVVPGHGPVMHESTYLDLMIDLLGSIKQQAEASFARGETLAQMRKSIHLDELRTRFCGDSQHKRFIFENYVFLPATAAAYQGLKEKH